MKHIFANVIFAFVSLTETKDFHRPTPSRSPFMFSYSPFDFKTCWQKKTFSNNSRKKQMVLAKLWGSLKKGKTFLWIFVHRIWFHLSCLSWETKKYFWGMYDISTSIYDVNRYLIKFRKFLNASRSPAERHKNLKC